MKKICFAYIAESFLNLRPKCTFTFYSKTLLQLKLASAEVPSPIALAVLTLMVEGFLELLRG